MQTYPFVPLPVGVNGFLLSKTAFHHYPKTVMKRYFSYQIIIFYFLSCKLGRNTEKVVPSPSFEETLI